MYISYLLSHGQRNINVHRKACMYVDHESPNEYMLKTVWLHAIIVG